MVSCARASVRFTFMICLSLSAIYLANCRQKRVKSNDINRTCRTMVWFDKRQQRLCNRYHFMMGTIRNGVRQGLAQCRELFKWHKWNCSPLTWTQVFMEGGILKKRSRETALVQALSAAGVLREIAIDCKKGKLSSCGCDAPKKRGNSRAKWQWGGCGHNIKFGNTFTKRFMDPSKINNHARRTEVHNHEVGRKVARDNFVKKCKCHGNSQSCALKTCWRNLPDMDKIGKIIYTRYKTSSVKTRWDKQDDTLLDRGRSTRDNKVRITADQLSFFADSEDFCVPNQSIGIMGTSGRVCNQTSSNDLGACSDLCCDRPVKRTFTETTESCNCRFVWCCDVKCDTCKVKRLVDTCT